MLRKSKFRMTKKSSQKSKPNIGIDLPAAREILQLRLSPETQVYVKCRIGDQIFGDTNWVFVQKHAILASLEFSPDFLEAQEVVKEYPDNQLLIGSYGFDQDIDEEFQLCTTVSCTNSTLATLELRRMRIEQIYDMPIYAWTSLGSEAEVLGMQNRNQRSLLVVEIDSIFPIFVGKRIFSIQAAKEVVECFASRHEYKNVWRKRVDIGCQSCPLQKSVYAQTRESTDLRHYTQYEQQVRVETPDPDSFGKILDFLDKKLFAVEDLLQFNYHIHLHINDYSNFANPYVAHVYTNYKEIVACQDIKKCQGKQVSCVSWNPFISGLFVASYVHTSFNHINYSEPLYEDRETFSEHVALVWSFSDMQKPKLYLHGMREITTISFCPYDENIVVGGCTNGQVVIWDIKGHLDKVENKEMLSPIQRNNQLQIANLILWMKKLPSIGHVDACVFSSLQHGHKTAITNITWIPPDYYISTTGQYTKSSDNNLHMQFLTSSLEDNNICVWDLTHCQNVKRQSKRKPLQRLKKMPPALYSDDSPLKKKHQFFIPIFVLLIKDPVSQKPLHIRSMLFKNQEYGYESSKTIQVENNFDRQYFRLSLKDIQFDSEQSFVVNTVSGMLYNCTWDGFTYDHGNKINFDSCSLQAYILIHDAPIKMCIANRDDPNIYMSIGGKVFAIWHRNQLTPILWRKCASDYIFGKWSHVHPFEILLFTTDGFIQLWNFFVNSKYPTYTVRAHGMPPVGISSNFGVEHYLSNAIMLFDQFGAIRVHTAGNKLAAKSVKTFENMKTFIETKKQVQNCVAYWCARYKKLQELADEVHVDKTAEHAVAFEANVDKTAEHAVAFEANVDKKKEEISKKQQFEKKQHKYMYEQLTEYKHIHLKQLEMNRKILNEVIIQSNELGRKCAQALATKDKQFEKKKRIITWDSSKLKRKIFKISLPKESASFLKKQYLDDYQILENTYTDQMKEFQFTFDWKKFEDYKLQPRRKSASKTRVRQANPNPAHHQAFNFNFRDTVHFKTVDLYDS